MVFQRIGREVLAQFFAFLITILDRFLLTGLLVRALGTTGFASWTVATAAAGMLTLFDLGFGPYFSNRLLLAVESGDDEDAREVFAVGNALLMSATLFGLAAVVAIYGALGTNVTGGPPKSMLTIVVGLLASSIAVRQALAPPTSRRPIPIRPASMRCSSTKGRSSLGCGRASSAWYMSAWGKGHAD